MCVCVSTYIYTYIRYIHIHRDIMCYKLLPVRYDVYTHIYIYTHLCFMTNYTPSLGTEQSWLMYYSICRSACISLYIPCIYIYMYIYI